MTDPAVIRAIKPWKPPYPYWGGKAKIAPLVWSRLGDVDNFIGPFFGGNSILLGRPHWDWVEGRWGTPSSRIRIEDINDISAFVPNFWRAIQADPEAVVRYADWPASEVDKYARCMSLAGAADNLALRCMGDPEYYDAKIAGWWVWLQAVYIGRFNIEKGPWIREDGILKKSKPGEGVTLQRLHLTTRDGVMSDRGRAKAGCSKREWLLAWFGMLSRRMQDVRISCCDWKNVAHATADYKSERIKGVFLDPPYSIKATGRDRYIYQSDHEGGDISGEVREWALERGDNPRLRIALCGYEGEHEMPPDWEKVSWMAHGGHARWGATRRENRSRERIWFSPHCLKPEGDEHD